jgi:hypothetical protein
MREARIGRVVLALACLAATGMLAATAAFGAEPEVPFWGVAGKRLESGTRSATITNASGVKVTLRSLLKGKEKSSEVEIRCETTAFAGGALEGSLAKHAGKISGSMELSGCKLFAKEGSAFKEEAGCTVAPIKSSTLSGALWLEGKKGEGSTAVVVFESKESPFAKVEIKSTGTCGNLEGKYGLSGSFAAVLLPQNEEFQFIQLVLPETAIASAWRPPGEEGETTVGLKLEGNSATLQGELKVELTSLEVFGGGTEPMTAIEAPFWGVEHKRLQNGEEDELEETTEPGPPPAAEPTRLTWKQVKKGTEVETQCAKTTISNPKIVGSLGQHDGKFKASSINFLECSFFAKEGGKFVQQKGCEVPSFGTVPLTGRLWLLGTRAQRLKNTRLVMDPTSLTEGKPLLTTEVIQNKGAEKCAQAEKYAIEGALPMQTTPENSEKKVLELSLKESSTSVWQSAEQSGERKVSIFHGSEPVFIKIPGIKVKLKKHAPTGGGEAEDWGDGSTGVGTPGPGPYWYHRVNSKEEGGTAIEEGAPETITGEGGEQRLKGKILGEAVEIVSKSVQVKGTIYNNALQGQAAAQITYTQPKIVKPAILKECGVTLGTSNVVKLTGHLVWKWDGDANQLSEGAPTAQTPTLLFTSGEIGAESLELPKGEFTKAFIKGTGFCTTFGGTYKLEGSLPAVPSTKVEAWNTKLTLTTPEASESLQHFWNGNEFIGTESKLHLAESPASISGQTTVKAGEEVAIFES